MQMREDTGKIIRAAGGRILVHGKYSTYKHYGCRCLDCKKAHNAYMRLFQQKKRGSKAMVEFETYAPFIYRHLRRGVTTATMNRYIGMLNNPIGRMLRNQNRIAAETFEKIKALPDDMPVGKLNRHEVAKENKNRRGTVTPKRIANQKTALTQEQIDAERKRRFKNIFRYFYQTADFTPETLAERIGFTVDDLHRFEMGRYENFKIATRLCHLHAIMRKGE